MNDFFAEQRSKTVVSILIRIESYIWFIIRTATTLITDISGSNTESETSESLMQQARRILEYDQKLGQMGVGLSRWPLPDSSGNITSFIQASGEIVAGLETFRGSSQGLNEQAKQIMDNHFILLRQTHEALQRVSCDFNDPSGQNALQQASNSLCGQIHSAKTISSNPAVDPWDITD